MTSGWHYAGSARWIPAVLLILVLAACRREAPTPKPTAPKPKTPVAAQTQIKATPAPAATPERSWTATLAQADQPSTGSSLIVSGRVTFDDGRPATDTLVEFHKIRIEKMDFAGEVVARAPTNTDGRYTLTLRDLQVGWVSATRKGSARCGRIVGLMTPMSPAKSDTGPSVRTITIDLVLPSAALVRGKVVDERDKPIASAKVKAVADIVEPRGPAETIDFGGVSETTTDSNGRFTFDDLKAGKVYLSASQTGYVSASQEATAPEDNGVIRLSQGGASLEGQVFLKSTGAAVKGAKVMLAPGAVSGIRDVLRNSIPEAQTDDSGLFRFKHLPQGSYDISASKGKLRTVPKGTSGSSLAQLTLGQDEAKTGYDLFLYSGHTLTGKVTDKATGQPLDGVRISQAWDPRDSERTSTTGPDGIYTLSGLYESVLALRVEKKGYRLPQDPRMSMPFVQVQLDPDNLEMTRDFQMVQSLTISGHVKTHNGHPVGGATVSSAVPSMHLAPQDEGGTKTDSTGAFDLEAAPFTPIRLKAVSDGWPPAYSKPIDVQNSPVTGVEIVLLAGASLSGVVVDPAGHPVLQAEVLASGATLTGQNGMSENFGSTPTDAQGQFSLSNLPAVQPGGGSTPASDEGSVILVASKTGFASSAAQAFQLTPGESKTGIKLALRSPNFLAGQVTNDEGKPLADVGVQAFTTGGIDQSTGSATTDADGRYRIEGLSESSHNVNVSHPEYGNDYKQNVAVGREDVDFVLGKGNKATLVGKVVDAKSRAPVAEFTVTSPNALPITKDPQTPGRFTAEGMAPGYAYNFRIESSGYSTLETEYILVPKGKSVLEKTFEMGPAGGIQGRIVSAGTKAPLAGVKVLLKGIADQWGAVKRTPDAEVTTAEDGLFHFEPVGKGKNTIQFIPPAPLAALTRTVDVDFGRIANMGDIELGGGGTIRGRVLRMPGTVPVPKVTLHLTPNTAGRAGETKETRTGPDGGFEFTGVSGGRYILASQSPLANTYLNLPEGQTKEIDLHVGGGRIQGRVIKQGRPFPANVSVGQQGLSNSLDSRADDQGRFEATDLAPGMWDVVAWDPGNWRTQTRTSVRVPEDGTPVEVTLTFPTGRITGKVLDATDRRVDGAQVILRRGISLLADENLDPFTDTTTTDRNGAFAFENLQGAHYTVTAQKEGMGMDISGDIEAPSDGEAPPVVLRLGAAEGGTLVSTALNLTDSRPIKDAWCTLSTSSGPFEHGQTRGTDGVVRIPGLPAGTYQVEVGSRGFSINVHTVEVKSGETVTLDDVLYEAGTFRWTLQDKNGMPLADVPCRLTPGDQTSIEQARDGRTGPDGLWVTRGLYPGVYQAIAALPDESILSETVTIQARQATAVTTRAKGGQ